MKGQLAEVLPDSVSGVMTEPLSKNTLPALALAVKHINELDPEAMIAVFASDHAIDNEKNFLEAWTAAEVAAEHDYLTLLGIKPTEPSTGYGYIKPGVRLESKPQSLPIFEVEAFVEKPERLTAINYVESGYLWNSGMFVFKGSIFMQMLAEHQPKLFKQINSIDKANIADVYGNIDGISIDYGLAEKVSKVAVVPVDMAWSDLGSWESIYEKHAKTDHHNVIFGKVVSTDTNNSLLWSESGVLATLGVDNLVVIQTADVTMICDKNRTEEVKSIVSAVKSRYPAMTETHLKVNRPWGSYTVLEETEKFKIKSIEVLAGHKLSLQKHRYRSEHWVVVSGVASVTIKDTEFDLNENESTYIPVGVVHRLENKSKKNLVIVEVQTGSSLHEDDIIRLEDMYDR